jgi:histidyl-tRNA synthetase
MATESMKISTVKGTNDYLPEQVALRDYLQSVILTTYEDAGFSRISTPAIEDIENLDKSDGGENLNLIFKILKRGEKLESALRSGNEKDLADMGLRYDLTLPLSRYYANNRSHLSLPAKCIQMDKVYRAERPQKGRLREFVQCDIDIIGSSSILCEIELIGTTAKALLAIGMKDFTVKVNDRRILRAMLEKMGFAPEDLDGVCIVFDKLDKVGVDGVRAELLEKGYSAEAVENLCAALSAGEMSLEKVAALLPENPAVQSVSSILTAAQALADGRYGVRFDLSLVRGQGYYTGTVFEVESNEFHGAIAGGGRYDNLIGKFTGETVPAVGFSIGFERIFGILSDAGFAAPKRKERIALFCEEKDATQAAALAESLRASYAVSVLERPKKLGKALQRLQDGGYAGYLVFGEGTEVKRF